MRALLPILALGLLQGCTESEKPTSFEIEGTQTERVAEATAILEKYGTPPGPLVDAHMAEEVKDTAYSRTPGPTDVYAVGVLIVRPEDLDQWKAYLADSPESGDADRYRPIHSYQWFPSEAELSAGTMFRGPVFIGRSVGWVVVSDSSATITYYGFNP